MTLRMPDFLAKGFHLGGRSDGHGWVDLDMLGVLMALVRGVPKKVELGVEVWWGAPLDWECLKETCTEVGEVRPGVLRADIQQILSRMKTLIN